MARKAKKKKTRRPWVACPQCKATFSEVARTMKFGQRRRRCDECGHEFTTRETVVGKKSDTGVTDLATGVTSLLEALRASPQFHLPPLPSK
jgi:hypothetical protein